MPFHDENDNCLDPGSSSYSAQNPNVPKKRAISITGRTVRPMKIMTERITAKNARPVERPCPSLIPIIVRMRI